MNGKTAFIYGLRIILIIGIIGMHLGRPYIGHRSVCAMFFILSGFLYREKNSYNWTDYIKRKLVTLYPIYLLALISCILAFKSVLKWNLALHVLLLQAWLPEGYFEYTGVGWFLSSLFFCYVFSHIIYCHIQKLTPGYSMLCLLGVASILTGAVMVPTEDSMEEWLHYINPLLCFCLYGMGMLLKQVIRKPLSNSNLFIEVLCLLVFLVTFFIMRKDWLDLCSWWIILPFIGLVYYAQPRFLNFVLGNKTCKWLSQYVLYVYLFHPVINHIYLTNNIYNPFLIIASSFVISIPLGMLVTKIRILL